MSHNPNLHHNLTTTAEFVLYFLNIKVCLWSFYWFPLSTHFLAFTTVLVFPLYAVSFVSLQLQLSKVECDVKRHSILYVEILRYADKSRANQFTLAKVPEVSSHLERSGLVAAWKI